jgi:uncharacterized protein YnzC (UPF0291/DUF896 family)
MSYTNTEKLGIEHTEWLKAIDFYDSEMDILENRLIEIVQKNNKSSVLAEVEHFQNQFIVQRNNIDEMRHNIKEHMHKVETESIRHAGHIPSELVGEHTAVKDSLVSFEKVIQELRKEFNDFLSKHM